MSLRDRFSIKALASPIGTLAALASIVSVLMTVYSAVEKSRSAVLVRIEKDLNTIPEALVTGAGLRADDRALYSNPDFGALRVEINNLTDQNFENTSLEVRNLKSFQGVDLVDNCLDPDTRSHSIKKWNQAKLNPPSTPDQKGWTALVLPLPRIVNGAYLKLSFYGLNVANADAELRGAGSIRKEYMIRVPDSWRLHRWYAYSVVSVSIILLVTAAALLVGARKARTAAP
jgi:hypothetical protein